MAKSKILKELANNEISLEIALSRLMIIASDIDDTELKNWATKELNGYGQDDEYPPYRLIVSGRITFTGIRGNAYSHIKYENSPLPVTALPTEYQEIITKPVPVRDSVANIAHIFENKQALSIDLTFLSEIVYESQGIQCTSIRQNFDYVRYGDMLSAIRTRLINIFIELDKTLGNLDDLDVQTENIDLKGLNQTIFNIIYQDNSVELGDKNKINKSKLFGGFFNGT